jgi:hypothetical protein
MNPGDVLEFEPITDRDLPEAETEQTNENDNGNDD